MRFVPSSAAAALIGTGAGIASAQTDDDGATTTVTSDDGTTEDSTLDDGTTDDSTIDEGTVDSGQGEEPRTPPADGGGCGDAAGAGAATDRSS